MKDVWLDSIPYFVTLGLYWVYNNFILVPDQPIHIQIGLLYLFVGLVYWSFKITTKRIDQLIIPSHYCLVVILCILGVTLGGFSQSELHQLSFNFSAAPERAINEYLRLKLLFYFIGIVLLPKVINQKPKIKKRNE